MAKSQLTLRLQCINSILRRLANHPVLIAARKYGPNQRFLDIQGVYFSENAPKFQQKMIGDNSKSEVLLGNVGNVGNISNKSIMRHYTASVGIHTIYWSMLSNVQCFCAFDQMMQNILSVNQHPFQKQSTTILGVLSYHILSFTITYYHQTLSTTETFSARYTLKKSNGIMSC